MAEYFNQKPCLKNDTNFRIKKMKIADSIAKNTFLVFASLSIITTLGIILSLLLNSVGFFKEVSILNFILGIEWTPLFSNPSFGVLPLLTGTFIVTVGAAFISIPIGLVSAIYLSEYANSKIRKIVKPLLEILAGVPSIVYGFFALNYITPVLQKIFINTEIYNSASASIAIGIMTIPMVSSLSEDALRAVPDSIRHGSLALGATKYETSISVVVRYAISGIVASFVLALSRAIGETMVVAIAGGAKPTIALNPLQSVQTMTAFIVQASQGDNPHGTIGFYSLFAVGLTLFIITLFLNFISYKIVKRFRKTI